MGREETSFQRPFNDILNDARTRPRDHFAKRTRGLAIARVSRAGGEKTAKPSIENGERGRGE